MDQKGEEKEEAEDEEEEEEEDSYLKLRENTFHIG